MKVALVHDYLSEFGGAERVLMALGEMFEKAPIYTAFRVKNSAGGEFFKERKVIESKFSFFLKKFNLYSPLRFLAPFIWRSFDLREYDLVIASSSWYITRGFRAGDKTKVVCYCHTPPRYLYGYRTSVDWERFFGVRIYARAVNHFLRMTDYQSAQKVDFFVANSINVKKRIKKFYRREGRVIYPPVEVKKIFRETKNLKGEDFYLVVARIVGGKGIEMVCEAAERLKVKVKIIGEGKGFYQKKRRIKRLENRWVKFLGRIPDEEVYQYYGRCKAFLATSKDEDFGISAVEAMAGGRPVVAYRGGGYLETVVEGKTGEFFDEYSIEGLMEAMRKLKAEKYKKEDCQRQAEKFSKEKFKREMEKLIGEIFSG